MKVRLTIVAEFEPRPEYYAEFTKECILETEQYSLEQVGDIGYLTIFDESEVTTNLKVVEE